MTIPNYVYAFIGFNSICKQIFNGWYESNSHSKSYTQVMIIPNDVYSYVGFYSISKQIFNVHDESYFH